MLSKTVVVASLLMLLKGAPIEVPLSKVSHLSTNVLNSVNRRNLKPQSMILYGGPQSPLGVYLAEIDTGSFDLLLIPEGSFTSSPRTACGSHTPPTGCFKTDKKSWITFSGDTTIVYLSYHICTANVTMAGVQVQNQYFGYGCQHNISQITGSPEGYQGILGLGLEHGGSSDIYEETDKVGKPLMSTISFQHGLPNSFALCFNSNGLGGRMFIGGGECANMQFVPLLLNFTRRESTYTVSISSISINNTNLSNTADLRALVDSGSSHLFVSGQLLQEFALKLCPSLKKIGVDCSHNQVPESIHVTPEQFARLPKIHFNLLNVGLVVPPQSYFLRDVGSNATSGIKSFYSYGILFNGYHTTPPGRFDMVLGIVALRGYWVYFDNQKQRIGFLSVKHCDEKYNGLLNCFLFL